MLPLHKIGEKNPNINVIKNVIHIQLKSTKEHYHPGTEECIQLTSLLRGYVYQLITIRRNKNPHTLVTHCTIPGVQKKPVKRTSFEWHAT